MGLRLVFPVERRFCQSHQYTFRACRRSAPTARSTGNCLRVPALGTSRSEGRALSRTPLSGALPPSLLISLPSEVPATSRKRRSTQEESPLARQTYSCGTRIVKDQPWQSLLS